ncbi:phytanoyl-CoA dioxygenase family protein [Roseobacter sp.]|uniref:phytanoyl-CoA dioxygenase family protein n=1 Tax=Roseobacter sp. TaxID=1907202 RepID=UPI00385CA0C5
MSKQSHTDSTVWLSADSCSLEDFRTHVERETSAASVPYAAEIVKNIPIYEGDDVRRAFLSDAQTHQYMAEWNDVLATGAGIMVVRNTYTNLELIDEVSEVLNQIIEQERKSGDGAGDHFAAAGANSRVWNAHEKLCMAAPDLFALYNANSIVSKVSQSWLGPFYQITTQVNVVRPGGKAQTCHRDYHMGFQSPEVLTRYPARVHGLSATLTLQGAIAHCDMPLESGPTKLLPFSQTYLPGYLAAQLPEFREYFEANAEQLPLKKGDTLYFNPAVFHAAGDNNTKDIDRMANLMQVGSSYGRSIEIVDRARMSSVLYPVLKQMVAEGALDQNEVACVVAACAEGYPFPANLDLDSPLSGMAPESQQELMQRALDGNWEAEKFEKALCEQQHCKRSH